MPRPSGPTLPPFLGTANPVRRIMAAATVRELLDGIRPGVPLSIVRELFEGCMMGERQVIVLKPFFGIEVNEVVVGDLEIADGN